jgi:hypothetical protein
MKETMIPSKQQDLQLYNFNTHYTSELVTYGHELETLHPPTSKKKCCPKLSYIGLDQYFSNWGPSVGTSPPVGL